ncbi:MAG: hypothetical protein AB1481_05535 [Candidatus Omnitrophota bacterium]
MAKLIKVFILLALISLAISLLLRVALPLVNVTLPAPPIHPPIEPHSFLHFADTCLLFAIALGILQLIKQK